jgi:hypothetical protein
MNLQTLRALGFDRSRSVPFTSRYNVACSSCCALVIQGTPTHERGCPSAMGECAGCSNLTPVGVRYCADCS